MATPEVGRLVDSQQFFDFLITKVDQLRVRYIMRCDQPANQTFPSQGPGGTLASYAFCGHALAKDAYLDRVRPETDQNGKG